MPNVFRTEEQRKHWNEYNKNYSNKNYRTITMKFNKEKDADIIEFLTGHDGVPATQVIRDLIRNRNK